MYPVAFRVLSILHSAFYLSFFELSLFSCCFWVVILQSFTLIPLFFLLTGTFYRTILFLELQHSLFLLHKTFSVTSESKIVISQLKLAYAKIRYYVISLENLVVCLLVCLFFLIFSRPLPEGSDRPVMYTC